MTDFATMTPDELRSALQREEGLLEDVKLEREFLGKQSGLHIQTGEFVRLDRDIERHERRIREIREALGRAGA